jgi:hypothetical protein
MSDPIVYKGTPLGDYFEGTPSCCVCAGMKMLTVAGTGTFETDYGVSSSSDHDETYSPPPGSSASSTDDDHLHDFAPPSTIPRKRFAGSKALKPLTILNENISRSTKFHNLFSVPLHPHPQRPVFLAQ